MAKEEAKQLSPEEAKLKALQAAMSKIEKDFGKGSIMKMGDEQIENVEVMDPNRLEKPHWLFTPLPKRKRLVALLPLLMPNTHSTAFMLLN